MKFYLNSENEICVSIINEDGSTWSGLKDAYFAQLGTEPTQADLDAIAKAEADAQAQAKAEADAQVAFEAQLAATNAKLIGLGLTAQDIATLLNAAKA